jgi:uncharacterized protein DUF1566
MKARRKTVTRRASRNPVLTLTQRLERLERHYFAQKPAQAGPRFTVTGDVVQDNVTGLTWTRKNVSEKRLNRSDAKAACAAARVGGFEDWRLPTIQELLTLVDYSRASPAIDTSAFECESNWYWTATPYASSPADGAWVVGFSYGSSGAYNQYNELCVRAVRPGQIVGSLV